MEGTWDWEDHDGRRVYPPIWGIMFCSDTARSNAAIALLETLRNPTNSPYTAPYVRDPRDTKGWRGFGYAEHGIPLWLLFEFDGAALFSLEPNSPDWMQGEFAQPIQLPRRPFATPHFYVHGYLDQVGQATAPDGDPAYVFKQFGRDIATAVRKELLP